MLHRGFCLSYCDQGQLHEAEAVVMPANGPHPVPVQVDAPHPRPLPHRHHHAILPAQLDARLAEETVRPHHKALPLSPRLLDSEHHQARLALLLPPLSRAAEVAAIPLLAAVGLLPVQAA